jgi:hypothetical protein
MNTISFSLVSFLVVTLGATPAFADGTQERHCGGVRGSDVLIRADPNGGGIILQNLAHVAVSVVLVSSNALDIPQAIPLPPQQTQLIPDPYGRFSRLDCNAK